MVFEIQKFFISKNVLNKNTDIAFQYSDFFVSFPKRNMKNIEKMSKNILGKVVNKSQNCYKLLNRPLNNQIAYPFLYKKISDNSSNKIFFELIEDEIKEIMISFGINREIYNEVDQEDELITFPNGSNNIHKTDDSVRWYLQLIGRVTLLRPEEEIQLAREISQLLHWEHVKISLKEKFQREPTNSEWTAACKISDVKKFRVILHNARRAKERMVAANLRLVVSIAKRYINRGMTLQDLIQEGSLGLIRAAEKFDSEKGFKFSTYATWWVKQAVTRAIADHSRIIRLPVHLYDTISAIRKATRALNIEIGRSPTEEEIAQRIDMSVEKLRSVLQSAQPTLSLERPLKNDEDASQLSDFIEADQESPEEHVEKSMLRDDLENVINSLSPRERDVVRMRYGLDDGRIKTLEEIGQIFSVTRERVRQIEAKAIRKLRQPYRSSILRDYVLPSSIGI
nr:RNA-polymerase sigma factor [Cryptomonas sp.]